MCPLQFDRRKKSVSLKILVWGKERSAKVTLPDILHQVPSQIVHARIRDLDRHK
jgi:hypothetical protein